jgi:hypothetical protein
LVENFVEFSNKTGLEDDWSLVWERTSAFQRNRAATPNWYKIDQTILRSSPILLPVEEDSDVQPNYHNQPRFSELFKQFVAEGLRIFEFEGPETTTAVSTV